MSETVKHECKEPENHPQHICQLRKAGLQDEVTALMQDPGHTCHNCNAVSKHSQALCNPSPFAKI